MVTEAGRWPPFIQIPIACPGQDLDIDPEARMHRRVAERSDMPEVPQSDGRAQAHAGHIDVERLSQGSVTAVPLGQVDDAAHMPKRGPSCRGLFTDLI